LERKNKGEKSNQSEKTKSNTFKDMLSQKGIGKTLVVLLIILIIELMGLFIFFHREFSNEEDSSNLFTDVDDFKMDELKDRYGLNGIIDLIRLKEFTTNTELIDFVRNFINENSIHKIDTESIEYVNDRSEVLSRIYNHSINEGNPPHLACGSRSQAMIDILTFSGVRSRLVHIFSDEYNSIQSHTFLEAYNTDTDQWEVHDPDFNIFYLDNSSSQRISAIRLTLYDLDAVTPCSTDNKCGWKENNVQHLKNNYFEALLYDNRAENEQSILLINVDRFDTSKQFPSNDQLDLIKYANSKFEYPFVLKEHELI